MRKIIITIMASTVVLSACGNDKVKQLEQKKSSLKSDNRKHKQEILDLEDKKQTYKQTEDRLKSEIKQIEKESSSQFTTQYLKSSTQFVNETKSNITRYNKINDNITSKFNNEKIKSELEDIYNHQQSITSDYKDELKDKTIPKDYTDLHKELLKLSTGFESAFKDLKNGYNDSDKKAIDKSIKKLNSLKTQIGQIK
nr:hypothetical protein [Mammaliicoccus sp. Marseille-Q6498]